MFEYAVVFTCNTQKYTILVKTADSPKQAIKAAMQEADAQNKSYTTIECIIVV